MGPEVVLAGAGGLLALALALVWSGWHFRGPAVELERARAERAELDLKLEKQRRQEDAERLKARSEGDARDVDALVRRADPDVGDDELLQPFRVHTGGDEAAPAGGGAGGDPPV